jgi:hypothetical protein
MEASDDIKRHFDAVADGLTSEIRGIGGRVDTFAANLSGEILAIDRKVGRLSDRLDIVASDLRSEILAIDEKVDRKSVELERHFRVVAESLRSEIHLVAEGFVPTNERLDRIETGMSERFGELETMIRLSFGELERRMPSSA